MKSFSRVSASLSRVLQYYFTRFWLPIHQIFLDLKPQLCDPESWLLGHDRAEIGEIIRETLLRQDFEANRSGKFFFADFRALNKESPKAA